MSSFGEDLAARPVEATWSPGGLVLDEHVDLYLDDPKLCFFSGEFSTEIDSPQAVFLGLRVTDKEMRKNKVATRLVSALAYIALTRNVASLYGSVESQHVIKIFRNLFGDENLTFYDVDPTADDGACIDLPITAEQAVALLEGFEDKEDDLEYRVLGFGVSVDLTGASIERLEKPLEIKGGV